MRKGSRELLRMQNLIENDRLNVGKKFEELFISDLKNLLEDYFEIIKTPTLTSDKTKNGYKIIVEFDAKKVRSVNFLPQEQV